MIENRHFTDDDREEKLSSIQIDDEANEREKNLRKVR